MTCTVLLSKNVKMACFNRSSPLDIVFTLKRFLMRMVEITFMNLRDPQIQTGLYLPIYYYCLREKRACLNF